MTMTEHDATPTPLYYAEDGIVWKRPVRTRNNNGGYSVSLGFPVCEMHEAAGKKNAETLAEMLCAAEGSAALAEENARLRNALEQIEARAEPHQYGFSNAGTKLRYGENMARKFDEIKDIARAALAPKEPEDV